MCKYAQPVYGMYAQKRRILEDSFGIQMNGNGFLRIMIRIERMGKSLKEVHSYAESVSRMYE